MRLGTRLMVSTATLIVLVVTILVAVSTRASVSLIQEEKREEAEIVAETFSAAFYNEVTDEKWNQMRLNVHRIAANRGFVYVLFSDARRENQIVAAWPPDQQERYIPDLVALSVSETALASLSHAGETWLLRDVAVAGNAPIRRGQRIVEVSRALVHPSGGQVGHVRVGISLKKADEATNEAVIRGVAIGALCMLLGLLGAWGMSRRIVHPVQELERSARQIADGDLKHRARVVGRDEIGTLAEAFNQMTAALQLSFERLQDTLAAVARFVPRNFVQVIAPAGVEHIQAGMATRRTITILFSDIRDYTSLSEATSDMEMFELLNAYLEQMGGVISAEGGFIDKYIGDAIMALFDHENCDGAVRAALGMQAALAEFNTTRRAHGRPEIAIGVGLHRGEVVMGALGYEARIETTVIGDAVNVASRIEGLTKQYRQPILISGEVAARLEGSPSLAIELIDPAARVKGKDEAIALYTVKPSVPETTPTEP